MSEGARVFHGPPTPGCRDCRLIAELCGRCELQTAAMGKRRSDEAMERDALISILRVLEPLPEQARERCLAAARCMTNQAAAADALEELDLLGAELPHG